MAMYKLFPQAQRPEAPPPTPNNPTRSMDASATAAALAAIATDLTIKIKAFRSRMKTKPSLLNTLIRWFSVIEHDGYLIVDELRDQNPADLQADGSWRMLSLRLWEMKEHLQEFARQLGDVTDGGATTEMGRSMLAMETEEDDLLPEVKQVQEEIDWRYRSLQVWLPFCLQSNSQKRTGSISSAMSAPAQVLTPPTTPDDRSIYTTSSNSRSYRRPSEVSVSIKSGTTGHTSQSKSHGHARRISQASTITEEDSPSAKILRAARKTDVKAVKQLLEEDDTGELASTVDPNGRTLIDLVICNGKRTSAAQVPMIKLLREWGAKFTLTQHKQHCNNYKDIVQTIKFQSKR